MPADEERLFVALYTDADVHGHLAPQVRTQGFDACSAGEKRNTGLSDEEQLQYATENGRAVLTHNIRDFEPLHHRWHQEGKHHAGIIISQRIGIGELLRRILRLLNHVTADEMRDSCRHLGEFAERKEDAKRVL